MIGKTLSHYKVIEKIGQGGMGEVYRAEDTSLSREVAIKVLPEQFTQDPQRLARFEREAKLLAQLNHPNIAAIHSFEHADDVHFLVLELVPGETLAERVAKGPLPVDEALEVCRQIAEGVEAAHEKGVIHRDLKPANVKVTPEGKVKILDFGLAKAFEGEIPAADISQSPTLTEEMTRAGVILGTAAYMSPEQAKGKTVDKRADIFAFGAVLYELLTGKRAFQGETITETLGAIIHKEPDWAALPESTPGIIQVLLRQCLQKDPNTRLRDIADFQALSETTLARIEPIGTAQPGGQRWAMAVGLVVLTAVVTGLAVWLLIQPSSPEQSLNRFVVTPSPPASLRNAPANELAISPDGRHFIYTATGAGGNQLYLRSLDDFVDRPIPGTEGVVGSPFFSPDGESVGFFAGGSLKKILLAGGSPFTLCEAGPPAQRGSWGLDDTIVFTAGAEGAPGLYQVPAAGGERQFLGNGNPGQVEGGYNFSHLLPDGKGVLASLFLRPNDFRIEVVSLDTGERKIILEHGKDAMYVETGHLIYEQAGTGNLMAVLFDATTLEVSGDPVPVLQGVRGNLPGYVDYAVSDNGTLVYVPGTGGVVGEPLTFVWVDREGREEPVAAEPRAYQEFSLSPDGTKIAVHVDGPENPDVWIYDLVRDTQMRLTFDPALEQVPIWTPDGQRVAFGSLAAPLSWKAADGTGEVETLVESSSRQYPQAFSPDGTALIFEDRNSDYDLGMLSLDGERTSTLLLETKFGERNAALSPDGRWMAYQSNESGQFEVYVRPFPDVNEGRWQVSSGGGAWPLWSPDARELFYVGSESMMTVPIETEPTFTQGTVDLLFDLGPYLKPSEGGNRRIDISPEGDRFLMLKEGGGSEESAETTSINVVLNWFEELKRLVPTP